MTFFAQLAIGWYVGLLFGLGTAAVFLAVFRRDARRERQQGHGLPPNPRLAEANWTPCMN